MTFKNLKNIFLPVFILLLGACAPTKSETDDENRAISTAKINTQLGMTYLEKRNIARAKQKLLLALEEAPQIPDTWYSMGYFLEVTGDQAEAKKYYLKALAIAPKRGDVQNNFGTYLCRQGNYRESIQHFELAAQDIHYIDTAEAYENAGLCAMKIPDKRLAKKYFEKSLERDPERATPYLELAELDYQIGDISQSKQNLDKFLSFSGPTKESNFLSSRIKNKTKSSS